MIDPQFLRKNPEEVAKRLATRGPSVFDLQQFQRLEASRKEVQTHVEEALAFRNRMAKEIGQAKAKGEDASDLMKEAERSKAELEASERELEKIKAELQDFLGRIPNIPHESVPVGASEEANREERRWGEPRKFDFPVKD